MMVVQWFVFMRPTCHLSPSFCLPFLFLFLFFIFLYYSSYFHLHVLLFVATIMFFFTKMIMTMKIGVPHYKTKTTRRSGKRPPSHFELLTIETTNWVPSLVNNGNNLVVTNVGKHMLCWRERDKENKKKAHTTILGAFLFCFWTLFSSFFCSSCNLQASWQRVFLPTFISHFEITKPR